MINQENDSASGNFDTVAFGSGVQPVDLMFEQLDDSLKIIRIGTTDSVLVQDWFLGSDYQAEVFLASDGSTLQNNQVDQLIQAMAAFSVESGVDWSDAVQQQPEEVQTIVTSTWQPTI